mgnify:CR=1 FL=1|tara:strand:+ start:40866 stop:41003 length:138 start_codon:yes stop_codon:yes gene_type:complete
MSIGIFPKISQIFPYDELDDLNEILEGCPSEFVLSTVAIYKPNKN